MTSGAFDEIGHEILFACGSVTQFLQALFDFPVIPFSFHIPESGKLLLFNFRADSQYVHGGMVSYMFIYPYYYSPLSIYLLLESISRLLDLPLRVSLLDCCNHP